MSVLRDIRRQVALFAFIVLALSLYRFRWGVLGVFNIGPPKAACSNIEALNTYLSTGGAPSAYLGRTPLIMCATEMGSYEVVSRLIELDVDVDAQKNRPFIPIIMNSDTGTTALFVSIIEEEIEIAKLLFESGADINIDTRPGSSSPLNQAIGSDRFELLRLFLEADDTVYDFDESRIRDAADDGDLEIFRILFEADISFGRTYEVALIRAASKGHTQLVKFLYEQGVSINEAVRPSGRTALHFSAQFNHIKVVDFLVSVGADINAVDDQGNAPIHHAAMSNNVEIAQVLVDSGADINLENTEGNTPFEVAVENDSIEVVNILRNERTST